MEEGSTSTDNRSFLLSPLFFAGRGGIGGEGGNFSTVMETAR